MANNLQTDPTRTTLLRRRFVADMVRRFKALSLEIQQLVVVDDAFGLQNPGVRFVSDLIGNVEFQAWRFQTNLQKVWSYRAWLKEQTDSKILTQVGGISGKPWTAPYIESAYKKGVLRAYTDSRKEFLTGPSDVFAAGRDEFLRTAFSSPEALSKVELLYERAFTELQGVTAAMDQQMSRILAEGLAQGQAPSTIARNLRDNVTKLTNTRAKVIARTEIIRAHAEGQLDAFEVLGVKELGLLAEWTTAGDDRVCAQCEELEGVVMTVKEARGLLPRHPNCRCAWIPANVTEKETGQLRGKEKDAAIERSIQKEGPTGARVTRTPAEVRRRSPWLGADKTRPKGTVPKGVVPEKPKVKVSAGPRPDKLVKAKISAPGKGVPAPEKIPTKPISLLKKEKLAIEDYTSDKFLELNRKLRGGLPLENVDKSLLNSLSSGLDKLPSVDRQVFRKVSFSSEKDLSTFLKRHKKGGIVKYKTPTSTSTDDRRFLFSGKGDVNLTVRKSSSGKDISEFSLNKAEKEVLFDRGKSFKIISAKQNNLKAWDIVLDETL